MIKTAAVVGAGITGCVLAERLAARGVAVTVFEQADEIGGLCRDGYEKHGVLVHHGGPHIFHTDSSRVMSYMDGFTGWRSYAHHVWAHIGTRHVPVPINAVTRSLLRQWGPDEVVEFLYGEYGKKAWGEHADEIAAEAEGRVPLRQGCDGLWFNQDRWQGVPLTGWTRMMERMLDSDTIEVCLSEQAWNVRRFDLVLWTGRPEPLLDWAHGLLAYRTTRFDFVYYEGDERQPYAVVNWPLSPPDWIRSTDYRKLTGQHHEGHIVGHEYPGECGRDDVPTYPVRTAANLELWQRYYKGIREEWPNVRLVGRHAEMRYLNMDQAVANALDVVDQIFA